MKHLILLTSFIALTAHSQTPGNFVDIQAPGNFIDIADPGSYIFSDQEYFSGSYRLIRQSEGVPLRPFHFLNVLIWELTASWLRFTSTTQQHPGRELFKHR